MGLQNLLCKGSLDGWFTVMTDSESSPCGRFSFLIMLSSSVLVELFQLGPNLSLYLGMDGRALRMDDVVHEFGRIKEIILYTM
jgi:hypothetical protein